MKPMALTCPVIVGGVSAKRDGSLGVRLETPELTPEEKSAFMGLMNRNLKMLLQPADEQPMELHEVKGEFDRKTPSQRLRAVLFVLYKQQEATADFEAWYLREMEKLIDAVKAKLNPMT